MANRITEYVRDPVTGDPIASVPVNVYLYINDANAGSTSTDANGRAQITKETLGYPGPIYTTAVSGGQTRRKSGYIWGQLGGLIWADDFNDVFQIMGNGILSGIGGEFVVTANGTNRTLTVASGTAVLKDGIPYVWGASQTITMTAGHATLGRKDIIVMRVYREGNAQQGRVIVVKQDGTPSATPVAPTPTQDADTWEMVLCEVNVPATTTVLSSGNLTDRRTYIASMPAALTRGDMLVMNSSNKLARLPVGTNGQSIVTDGVDVSWGSAVPTPGDLPSGIDATKIANGSVTNTEFQYLANVDYDIQAQLDATMSVAGGNFLGSVSTSANWTVDGSIRDNSGAGWTSTAGGALGSSPGAVTRERNEYCGRIVQTTGSSGTAPGIMWTITFQHARATSNYIAIVQGGNDDTAGLIPYVSSTSTTGFTISCVNDPPNSTQMRVNWLIVDAA